MASYHGTGRDSSAALQNCINNTPNGKTLLLPVGVLTIESEVLIKHPMTISRQAGWASRYVDAYQGYGQSNTTITGKSAVTLMIFSVTIPSWILA